ncbi:alkaline phosphatase PhoX [Novosphingobium sp.]|uniref:alkaline phosphatase PhoX n=1 Tax=Novosphingobium sp. TaxID=1874826 RepID=UPI00262F6BCF|nr:alkaline phosphatase PhoX [Novosphingobium sp.]
MSSLTPAPVNRRTFNRSLAATAFGGLAALLGGSHPHAAQTLAPTRPVGPLVPDPAGILDLPEGWRYTVISRMGDAMDDGHVVADKADGMGCFAIAPGKVALVRNHELGATEAARGPFANRPVERTFDRWQGGRALPGGTSTLVYNLQTGQVEAQYASLAGTIRNCAGGITPWGTWLSCEENVSRAGRDLSQDHGWVFEVPATARGLVDPVPLKGLGRFNHEAAAVDPRTGIVYLTEDREDGLFYRFVPLRCGDLRLGGRLQALGLAAGLADTRNKNGVNLARATPLKARWIDLQGTDSANDDLRERGHAAGAALFARGEGIHFSLDASGMGEFYFVCTSGGAAKLGQVFRYRPQDDTLDLFYESTDPDVFNFGDNLTIAPNGHLIVCEDQYTAITDNHLRGITPAGIAYALARCRRQTELAGACFSPDGSTLFVNLYSPAMTLAIPWRG